MEQPQQSNDSYTNREFDLLIKIPTRSRPEKFKQIVNAYYDKLSRKHRIRFLFSIDADDATMNNPEMLGWLNNQPKGRQDLDVVYCIGNSKSKIEAVNADVSAFISTARALLVTSDDMIPILPGFDDVIVTNLRRFFGPTMDGVLHFNDGRQGARLNTLPIMGAKYYDRFGYVYHPDYISLYADNEFTDVAAKLGRTVYFDTLLIQHGWMDFIGKDSLFERNEAPELYAKDKETYERRKKANFENNVVQKPVAVPS